jgi:hypothetical protein
VAEDRPLYESFEASLLAQGFEVRPPDVRPDGEDDAWEDDDEFALDDSDAPILEEALAERTYVRDVEAGPPARSTPAAPSAPSSGATIPRTPDTLADVRPPVPSTDLRERLRALVEGRAASDDRA